MAGRDLHIIVENVPEDITTGFILANHQCGMLWYWSHYDTYEEAVMHRDDDGVNRVVISVTGEPGYIKMPEEVEDGVYFTTHGSFTTTSWYEISKEEFDRVRSIPNWERELGSACKAGLSDSIRYGYGFAGCSLTEGFDDDEKTRGKYFYTFSHYSSCD